MISRYRNYVLLNDENEIVEKPSDGHIAGSRFSRNGSNTVLVALLPSLVLNTALVVLRLHISERISAFENSVYGTSRLLIEDLTLADPYLRFQMVNGGFSYSEALGEEAELAVDSDENDENLDANHRLAATIYTEKSEL